MILKYLSQYKRNLYYSLETHWKIDFIHHIVGETQLQKKHKITRNAFFQIIDSMLVERYSLDCIVLF
jgi:hypothetical protein